MTPSEEATTPSRDRGELLRITLFVLLAAFLTSLVGAVAGRKLLFLYKEELHLSAGQVGTLMIVLGIPSYLQPFMGAAADVYPLFGYHRRTYFATACVMKIVGYTLLAMLTAYHYAAVLGLVLVATGGTVLLGVIINAAMVSIGNRTGTFGTLQSLYRLVPLGMTILFAAHLSGYITQVWPYPAAFSLAAGLCVFTIPLALLIDERRVTARMHLHETPEEHALRVRQKAEEQKRKKTDLRRTAALPGLWAITLFVFYLIVTPGLNTAQVYYETDVLGFSKQFIGDLGIWQAAGAITGLLLFGALSPFMRVRTIVWGAWLMDCVSYPAQMYLHDPVSAMIVEFALGMIGILYAMCLYTLAARACPPGIEGAVYGLVLAAIALGGTLSEKMGSTFYDMFGPASHHSIAHGWYTALWCGFAFTVAAIVLFPFLPTWARSNLPLKGPSPWEPPPEPAPGGNLAAPITS